MGSDRDLGGVEPRGVQGVMGTVKGCKEMTSQESTKGIERTGELKRI